MRPITRRAAGLLGLGGASAALSGCVGARDLPIFGVLFADLPVEGTGPVRTPDYDTVYGKVDGERHPVPPFDYTNLDPAFLRAEIAYAGLERPGTIIVDPRRHQLFLVGEGGRAMRYGIAVGSESKGFSGVGEVAARRVWPDWEPSGIAALRGRVAWAQLGPDPARRLRGIPGGPRSPRGARALYLATAGQDAGYSIHGTPDPQTVGTDVVPGCIGLINQDVIDLYGRVAEGVPAVVLA